MRCARTVALLAGLAGAQASPAEAAAIKDGARRTDDADFELTVRQRTLANGLTVVLAPDPGADEVWVQMAFRAGALYEPEGRSGMAHYVEHLLATGVSEGTDYASEAERRGASYFNAHTGPEQMSFELGLPPEELPWALWSMADRVGRRVQTVEQALFDSEKQVVLVERLLRDVDRPYARADALMGRAVFPAPHRMHDGVVGHPREMVQATPQEVTEFVRRYVHASNGVLVVVGRFELSLAEEWIERTVARLDPGPVPAAPDSPAPPRARKLETKEVWSREPRVTLLWRLPRLGLDDQEALRLGALLLESYLDGAFGTRIAAGLLALGEEHLFRLDVMMPHDKPKVSAEGEATVFLRYLTAVDMPRDYFDQVRVLRDLAALYQLDTLHGRSAVLTELFLRGDDPSRTAEALTRHWRLVRSGVRSAAWRHLITGVSEFVVHARPVRPRQPKLSWEERAE